VQAGVEQVLLAALQSTSVPEHVAVPHLQLSLLAAVPTVLVQFRGRQLLAVCTQIRLLPVQLTPLAQVHAMELEPSAVIYWQLAIAEHVPVDRLHMRSLPWQVEIPQLHVTGDKSVLVVSVQVVTAEHALLAESQSRLEPEQTSVPHWQAMALGREVSVEFTQVCIDWQVLLMPSHSMLVPVHCWLPHRQVVEFKIVRSVLEQSLYS